MIGKAFHYLGLQTKYITQNVFFQIFLSLNCLTFRVSGKDVSISFPERKKKFLQYNNKSKNIHFIQRIQ